MYLLRICAINVVFHSNFADAQTATVTAIAIAVPFFRLVLNAILLCTTQTINLNDDNSCD